MFPPRFVPCAECGESVERSAAAAHSCNRERRLEYQMLALRDEIVTFETRFQRYLDTARGRFEVWLAARQVGDDLR